MSTIQLSKHCRGRNGYFRAAEAKISRHPGEVYLTIRSSRKTGCPAILASFTPAEARALADALRVYGARDE